MLIQLACHTRLAHFALNTANITSAQAIAARATSKVTREEAELLKMRLREREEKLDSHFHSEQIAN